MLRVPVVEQRTTHLERAPEFVLQNTQRCFDPFDVVSYRRHCLRSLVAKAIGGVLRAVDQ